MEDPRDVAAGSHERALEQPVKRKKNPPSEFVVSRLQHAQTVEEVSQALSEVRYAGDIKQLAEMYGLHYLKSKRMRTRELRQWILDNHPAAKAVEEPEEPEEPKFTAGVDWGLGGGSAVVVAEQQPDGSLKILNAEVIPDGKRGPAGAD